MDGDGAAVAPNSNDNDGSPTAADHPSAVETKAGEAENASPQVASEEAAVQMTISFEAPVKEDKEEIHGERNDSPSVKGGYNLRHQPRGVARLVDQSARLSMRIHGEKARKAGKAVDESTRILTGRFAGKIGDHGNQSMDGQSKAGDRRGRRRPKRRGPRSKLQKKASSKGVAQRNKRQRKTGAKRIGRPPVAARGRPRTRDPYKFNDNASVPMVGRLMHVHPPKRVSCSGLQDDIQRPRNVAAECLASSGQSTEASVEMPHEASVPVSESSDDQIQD